MAFVSISEVDISPANFNATAMTELTLKKNLILLIFRIPPGFWGHRARFACLFGLLASSFTLDHHERHKSLFFAKSRKKCNKNMAT